MSKHLKTVADLKINDSCWVVSENGITTRIVKSLSQKKIEISNETIEIENLSAQGIKGRWGDFYYFNKCQALKAQDVKYDEMLQKMLKDREDFIIKLTNHYNKIRENDRMMIEESIYITIK